VTASYGVTDRFSLSLTLPFSRGTHSRYYADGVRHEVTAGGLGDVSLIGTAWLFSPAAHVDGNLAIGIGLKAPTGKHDAIDAYYLRSGATQFSVDQSIQPGDGGWGVILQAQAFQHLLVRSYGYASGSYLVSPKNQTDVIQGQSGPYSAVRVSVPDVFSARAGVGYELSPNPGVSVRLGGRLDGIPFRDLVGGSDGFRRPAIIWYLEPGVTIGRGRNAIFIDVPVRVYSNFRPSALDMQLGQAGGGDLANYLLLAAYQFRF
jgi:hypothetical protein